MSRYGYHANRLGSVIAVTASETGAVVDRYRYSLFGVEVDGNTSGNPFRYTGRRYDPEYGLYYYRARYYSPELGRFLQTDTIGYADQMNLYAYVGNNPLNATDPTGMCPWCVVGVIVGAGLQAYSEVQSGNLDFSDGFEMSHLQALGRIGVAGAAGALGGGAGTVIARTVIGNGAKAVATRVGSNAIAGGVLGAGNSAGQDLVSGREVDYEQATLSVGVGAALGGGGAAVGEAIGATGNLVADGIESLTAQSADDIAARAVDFAEMPGPSGRVGSSAESARSTGQALREASTAIADIAATGIQADPCGSDRC